MAFLLAGSSLNSRQSGKRHIHTFAKCLAFPLTKHLYLQYRAAQARIHPTSRHKITLRQPRQMGSARRLMGMVPQCQNLTANSSNVQNRMRSPRLPVRSRQMLLPPHWRMPVRPPPIFPSYLWKASSCQRCRQRRKWRAYFSNCVNARWSMSILGISFSSVLYAYSVVFMGIRFSLPVGPSSNVSLSIVGVDIRVCPL